MPGLKQSFRGNGWGLDSNLQSFLPSTFRAVLPPLLTPIPQCPDALATPGSCTPRKSHSHDRAQQALVTQIVLRFYRNYQNTYHAPSATPSIAVYFVLGAAAYDSRDGTTHQTCYPSAKVLSSSPLSSAHGSHVRRWDAGNRSACRPSPLPFPRSPSFLFLGCGGEQDHLGMPAPQRAQVCTARSRVYAPRPFGFSWDPLWLSEAESTPAWIPVMTAFTRFKLFKLQAKHGSRHLFHTLPKGPSFC